ncbi:MAG TPA: hypothetical protein VMU67_13900 [Steroidobacteraceae bacterium]|nr:hypothetical protein [Steroidobacteraceae bacterium]
MSRRLTPEQREQILADLALRERLTMKALSVRYGVSRRTLVRLREELIASGALGGAVAQNAPNKPPSIGFNNSYEEHLAIDARGDRRPA